MNFPSSRAKQELWDIVAAFVKKHRVERLEDVVYREGCRDDLPGLASQCVYVVGFYPGKEVKR